MRFPSCAHGYLGACPEDCRHPFPSPIDGLPLKSELTLDIIEAHLKSLGLRSRVSWRGGEWTVQLTSRKEEHQKTPIGRRIVGRDALIEKAFEKALEIWNEKGD